MQKAHLRKFCTPPTLLYNNSLAGPGGKYGAGMESKINYTLVGLFVVFLTAGLITFAYWLGKHGGKQEYDTYLVYMSESVAGLSTDASVKYKGVNVGTVQQLGISPHNSEEVELRLQIVRSTPIKTDTTAQLKSFGITGLAFIELSGGSKDAPLLKTSSTGVPIIPATPSTFTQMYASLEQLVKQSTLAMAKFDRILSEKTWRTLPPSLRRQHYLSKISGDNCRDYRMLLITAWSWKNR